MNIIIFLVGGAEFGKLLTDGKERNIKYFEKSSWYAKQCKGEYERFHLVDAYVFMKVTWYLLLSVCCIKLYSSSYTLQRAVLMQAYNFNCKMAAKRFLGKAASIE